MKKEIMLICISLIVLMFLSGCATSEAEADVLEHVEETEDAIIVASADLPELCASLEEDSEGAGMYAAPGASGNKFSITESLDGFTMGQSNGADCTWHEHRGCGSLCPYTHCH
jgi:hypothetical protein